VGVFAIQRWAEDLYWAAVCSYVCPLRLIPLEDLLTCVSEASYVVVRLLQKFDKIEPGANELEGYVRSGLNLTNAPGKKVTLKLHQASDN